MTKKLCAILGLAAFLIPYTLNARYLFLTGGDPSGTTINAYTTDPISFGGSLGTVPGVFTVLQSGSKFYAVGKSATETVGVMEGSFPSLTTTKRINLGQAASAAVLSPDGRRLLVVAAGLHIIDTATDTLITTVDVGTNPIDVAVSVDGFRAYALSAASQKLSTVDLASNSIAGSVSVPGITTAVSAAPNGLVYVSAQNAVYEFEGRSLVLRGTISVRAQPGKLSFTPNGNAALGLNQTTVTGTAAIYIDLGRRAVFEVLNQGFTLDDLAILNASTAFAMSSQNGKLYQIPLTIPASGNQIGMTEVNTFAALGGNARSLTQSPEVPQSRFIFIATTTGIYRYDVASTQYAGPASGGNLTGQLSYTAPAVTGTPSNYVQYNATQTVASGQNSLPLVVRALDAAGTPISGVPVTYTLGNQSVSIVVSTPSTNLEGYASAIIAIPTTLTSGAVTVTAVLGTSGVSAPFTINIGSGETPGPGPGQGGLSIFRGQGELIPVNFSTVNQEPLTVLVRDASGRPLSGISVSWSVTQGQGTLDRTASITDAEGKAQANFTSSFVPPGTGFSSVTIAASTATESVNFFVTVLATQSSGQPGTASIVLQKPIDRNLVARIGEVLPGALQFQVIALNGLPLPNVGLRVFNDADPALSPTAACRGVYGLSDATGILTCDLIASGRTGQTTVTARVGSFSDFTLNLTVEPGAPADFRLIQGNNQSGNPGQTTTQALVAEVVDAVGNRLAGVDVTWQVAPAAAATLVNTVSRSDANGRVSTQVRFGSSPGQFQVSMTAGAASRSFTLTTNVTVTSLVKVTGDNQTAEINRPFAQPISVRVLDDQQRPVVAQVTFAVTAGSAIFGNNVVNTGSDGVASTTVTAGGTAGAITITASTGGLSQTFNLTARLPGPAFTATSFVSAAGFQPGIAPGSIAVVRAAGVAPNVRGSVTPPSLVTPLPTRLADVEVLVNNVSAPLYAVSNVNGEESVTFQVPFETPPGNVSVTIRVGGGSTTVNNVQILPLKPGIFEFIDANERRYAVTTRPDGSFVTSGNLARRGEIIRVYVTGLGQTTPPTATNRVGIPNQSVAASLVVGLNNEGVRVVSAVLLPGLIGVYEVAFEVPSTTAAGTAAPFAVAVTGSNGELVFGNGSAIPVQ